MFGISEEWAARALADAQALGRKLEEECKRSAAEIDARRDPLPKITLGDLLKPGRIVRVRNEVAPAPCALTHADIQRAATEGRNTERDRARDRLFEIEPGREPYSKLQSEWERRGARRMWERCMEAIVDGKEAHKDRDALEGGE